MTEVVTAGNRTEKDASLNVNIEPANAYICIDVGSHGGAWAHLSLSDIEDELLRAEIPVGATEVVF